MSCSNSVPTAVLTDYWIAALPKSEEESVEEHLFACDECGGRLREVIALADNSELGPAGLASHGR